MPLSETTAIAVRTGKDAALWFDYVIIAPYDVNYRDWGLGSSSFFQEQDVTSVIRELAPPELEFDSLTDNSHSPSYLDCPYVETTNREVKGVFRMLSALHPGRRQWAEGWEANKERAWNYGPGPAGYYGGLIQETETAYRLLRTGGESLLQDRNSELNGFFAFLQRIQHRHPFLFLEQDAWDCADRVSKRFALAGKQAIANKDDAGYETAASISLSGLKLIDTTHVSWDHILEFRKHGEAKRRLRELRLFFHQNWRGQPPQFIEDDLQRRIDEYNRAVSEWGFATVNSAISTVAQMTRGSAPLAAILSWFAAWCGEPAAMVAASAISGTILGMSFEIAKNLRRRKMLSKACPIAYILEARRSLA